MHVELVTNITHPISTQKLANTSTSCSPNLTYRGNNLLINLLTSKVTINLNMLYAFMKYGIRHNAQLPDYHILTAQEPNYQAQSASPHQCTCQLSHGFILLLCTHLDMTGCFLLLQDTKLPPTNTQYPVIDFLSFFFFGNNFFFLKCIASYKARTPDRPHWRGGLVPSAHKTPSEGESAKLA